jgi:hypothetical protein
VGGYHKIKNNIICLVLVCSFFKILYSNYNSSFISIAIYSLTITLFVCHSHLLTIKRTYWRYWSQIEQLKLIVIFLFLIFYGGGEKFSRQVKHTYSFVIPRRGPTYHLVIRCRYYIIYWVLVCSFFKPLYSNYNSSLSRFIFTLFVCHSYLLTIKRNYWTTDMITYWRYKYWKSQIELLKLIIIFLSDDILLWGRGEFSREARNTYS